MHPDGDVGVGESAVAYLRVKVALRAQHYDLLTGARTGRLGVAFQSKFGWLLGNLYSRAASPDWADRDGGAAEVRKLVEDHLREQIPELGPVWFEDELVDQAEQKALSLDGKTHAELATALEAVRPLSRIDKAVDAVLSEVTKVIRSRRDLADAVTQVNGALAAVRESHPGERMEHVDRLAVGLAALVARIEPSDDLLKTLRNRLANNGTLRSLVRKRS